MRIGLAGLVIVLAAVACGGQPAPTVADYATWREKLYQAEATRSEETWGDVTHFMSKRLEYYEDVTAPEELEAFHDAMFAFQKARYEFIRRQDPVAPAVQDLAEMEGEEGVAEVRARGDRVRTLMGTLDDETLALLNSANCFR